MKQYSFTDPDDEEYEITIPSEVVREIILNYMKTTYYWSVGILSFVVGILLGVII
jgi:hypothetical protein